VSQIRLAFVHVREQSKQRTKAALLNDPLERPYSTTAILILVLIHGKTVMPNPSIKDSSIQRRLLDIADCIMVNIIEY
jgi:hypothetical protein